LRSLYTYMHVLIYIYIYATRFMVDTVAESSVWLDPPGVMARRLLYIHIYIY